MKPKAQPRHSMGNHPKRRKVKNKGRRSKHVNGKRNMFSNLMFYGCLCALLYAVLTLSSSTVGGISIMGYHFLEPLTTSMQSVYPQGGVMIVQEVNPESIQVGDDITFLLSPTQTGTHRCIEILHDYEHSGMTVYRTQGVDNPMPDAGVVYQDNVIGKVVYYIPYIGRIASFINTNLFYILLGVVIISLVVYAIKTLHEEG